MSQRDSNRHMVHPKLLLRTTSAFLALAISHGAAAQTFSPAPSPPVRSPIDENGVNVASGQVVLTTPTVSIGSDSGSHLEFGLAYSGVAWAHNFYVALTYTGSSASVITGGSSDAFTQSGSTFTGKSGNGTTLVSVAGGYRYTMRDGTIVNFSTSILSATYQNVYSGGNSGGTIQAVATSMVMPNGEVINFTYKQQTLLMSDGRTTINFVRLQSVNSSAGLQMKMAYAVNAMTNTGQITPWLSITNAKAINNGIDYCDPAADSCATLTRSWPTLGVVFSSGSVAITDPAGNATTYTLNASGKPSAVKYPGSTGNNLTASYDANGFVSSLTKDGSGFTYAFTQSGGVTSATLSGAAGTIRQTTANATTGSMQSIKDGSNNTTSYTNDSFGRATNVTHPEGNYETYTYDARGNVTQQTIVPKAGSGLANIVLLAGYDATCSVAVTCNKPNWTRDALGNQTDYTYDPTHGGVLTMTAPAAPSGVRPQVRNAYTPMQAFYKNSSGSVVASGANIYELTSTSTCRTNASCAGTADETKVTVGYGPQSAGTANNLFPISSTVAAGDGSLSATTGQAYDDFGNVASTTGPLGAAQTTVSYYDADRRRLGTVGPDPDGAGSLTPAAIKYTYNANGTVIQTQTGTVTDQSAAAWANFSEAYRNVTTFDAYDRPVRATMLSGSTTYSVADQVYDGQGRVSCTIEYMNLASFPASAATSCTPFQTTGQFGPDRVSQTNYDVNGRVLSVAGGVGTSGAKNLQTQGYNPNGTVAFVVDGQSNRTSFTYDGFDRLSKTNYPSPTQGANASNASDYEQLTYNANGKVTSQRLRDGNSIAFSYDNLSRPSSRTPSGEAAVNFTYDLLGNPTIIARPSDGVTITRTFDSLGRMTNESQAFGSVAYQYDVSGRRTRLTWGDGVFVGYDYDVVGNVTAIRENGATSGIGVLATYSYDSLGRRTAISYGNGTTRSYSWDAVSRSAGQNFDLAGTGNDLGWTQQYNPAGEITQISRSNSAYNWNGAYNVQRNYTTNGLNQYTAAGTTTFTYDARGNLSASGTSTYAYDKLNELSNGPGTTLYYDPQGRLVEYDTSSSTRFLYDGGAMLAEVANPSGSILRRYVPGPDADEPIVWYEGAGTADRRFLQADERGSIVAIVDGAGNIIAINAYDEYGIPQSTNVGRFQYTGQAWLPELGLQYSKARMYSPTLGRFMQTDPIGYGDGLNWYNYAHSDPINGRDPSGNVVEIVVTGGPTNPVGAVTTVASLIASIFGFSLFGGAAAAPVVSAAPASAGAAPNPGDIVVTAQRYQLALPEITLVSASAGGLSVLASTGALSPTVTCTGVATYTAVGGSQAQADGALYSKYPDLAGGSIPGGTFGTVGVQRGFLGLNIRQLRTWGRSIQVMPSSALSQSLIGTLKGPTGYLTVSDFGDINVQNTNGTAFDIYRFPTEKLANTFGRRTLQTTIRFPRASGGHCPAGFTGG